MSFILFIIIFELFHANKFVLMSYITFDILKLLLENLINCEIYKKVKKIKIKALIN